MNHPVPTNIKSVTGTLGGIVSSSVHTKSLTKYMLMLLQGKGPTNQRPLKDPDVPSLLLERDRPSSGRYSSAVTPW